MRFGLGWGGRIGGLLAAALLAGAPAPTAPPAAQRVRLETSAGPIVIELATRAAPLTTTNFLRYVDNGRFDGTTFYRAARAKRDPKTGLVQGGINTKAIRAYPPIAHEPTGRTGLHHVDGTVSMARASYGTAMGDFFIVVGPAPYLDERPGSRGYAAFGKVVAGMPLVRRILGAPTWPGGYSRETIGQSLREPVRIVSARRVK
ncbi:peptidylprolyl isomerase [Sphingomonas solaris]|uniref:peptidylprolyl isomerase n=1 Tax=Alterirhizorhabdus solaris TaxID=2529389 RepID=UPI001EEFF836|nr:peptidylprolyl isomerase [Sphingomonas solaris]